MPKKISDKRVIELVNDLHFKQGFSLRRIERDNGLSNDTLRKRCLKLGVKTKGRKESIQDNEKHVTRESWRNKNPERSAELALQHSISMKNKNPSHNKEVLFKSAISKAELYKLNPTRHESCFIKLLDSIGHAYEFQFPVMQYIADFKIGSCLIELDGRGHSGRQAKDLVRDKALCAIGYSVVRIDQDCLLNFRADNPVFRPHKLLSAIEDLVSSFKIPATLPAVDCKHRVIVRKPNPFTEVIY